MPSTHRLTRRVAFSETDAAGLVHFANFFRYMEDTEHDFLRSLGLTVHRHDGPATSGFPRVSATCDYQSPLHFEDQIDITLTVERKTARSLTYAFTFTRHGTDEQVATGRLTVVHVTRPDPASPYRATPLPPAIDAALEVAASPSESADTRSAQAEP